MTMTSHPALRELDLRDSDGIDVRLPWNPLSNRVSIAVRDERSGDFLAFEVREVDALDVVRHPVRVRSEPPPGASTCPNPPPTAADTMNQLDYQLSLMRREELLRQAAERMLAQAGGVSAAQRAQKPLKLPLLRIRHTLRRS